LQVGLQFVQAGRRIAVTAARVGISSTADRLDFSKSELLRRTHPLIVAVAVKRQTIIFRWNSGGDAMHALIPRRDVLAFLSTSALCRPALAQAPRSQDQPAPGGRTIVMKLATPALNDFQHEWIRRYAAAIEKKSNGRIRTELYPGGQLGPIPRMIESTQLGSIQIFVAPPEFFVGLDQRFELLSAAGVIGSEQHAARMTADPEFTRAFLAIGAGKGLVGLNLFGGTPSAFAMRRPFRTLGDLKGRKIRILPSPFQIEQMARLGATGVPLSLADVLPALQQGTIDGAQGNLGIFTALGYYDSARYMNETAHAFTFSMAVASRRWFDVLPAGLQAAMLATAGEVGAEMNPWAGDFLNRQRRLWVEKGGEIDTLPPADRADMAARISSVGDDIVKTKPELAPMWERVRAAAQRTA
jgi:TRAP-type C4-dicarboxylate transport system substrate-binding protein